MHRRSWRSVDLDVCDRVPFNMVRVQTVSGGWKEDCLLLVPLPIHTLHSHELTILQGQRRRLRVHGCHGSLHHRVWRVLQRHRDRNADEA